ncbi:MAG: superinfection immunity protein [Lysobacteraceae bacterium]|jgi:hypothetical protein|nr:MAG: superinfection immunity protein [Xanthomonadaceae bacterium]
MTTFVIIVLCLYFVPAIIALVRNHHNKIPIIALNILLGWSVLGWVAALIWSLMAAHPKTVVVRTSDLP